ncbi:MAG: amidohydrolase family protein [Desulfosarcina sp.]|nr:amidohydrolase family protein [Desulfobacterales bacterium]
MKTKKINIRAGWLIDGTGAPARRNVILKIENGIIQSLSDLQFYNVDQDDIADFSAYTIIPGLIDSHVHLCMSGTDDQKIRQKQLKSTFADAEHVISTHLRQSLLSGVIAVRDGGDYGAYALRYKKKRYDIKKSIVEIKTAGRAWRNHGRYGKLIGRPPSQDKTLGEEILDKDESIDHVKIVNSGLNSLKEFGKETSPQFNPYDLKDAVNAASSLGLKVMVHANGRLPVENSIEAGCASIEHGFFMGEKNLGRMAEKKITWVPTACTMKAYAEYLSQDSIEAKISRKTLEDQIGQLVMARALGVTVAVGTDSGSLGVHHGSSIIEELKLFMQAGFSLEETLKASVLNGSALMGLNKTGPIIKGNKASFIVVDGPPAGLPESLKNIKAVYKEEAWH